MTGFIWFSSAVHQADEATAINDVFLTWRWWWNLDAGIGGKFFKTGRMAAIMHNPDEKRVIQRAQIGRRIGGSGWCER